MERKMKEKTEMTSFCIGLRLPDLIKTMDSVVLSSEKKCLKDALWLSEREDTKKKHVEDFGEILWDKTLYDHHLGELLKHNRSHEVSFLPETIINENNEVSAVKRVPEIPDIRPPLCPTSLLDRVLEQRKMKREIVIPTMTPKDSSSSRSSHDVTHSSAPSGDRCEKYQTIKKRLPHFSYAHGEGMGTKRNLPGQPELIRLLTDSDISLGKIESEGLKFENSQSNQMSILSLYGGTMSPPLIDKDKQRKQRRRKIVCKYCRRQPGNHQIWCIYYDLGNINEEKPQNLARSYTEEELELSNTEVEKMPVLERSKTSVEDYMFRPDLPDFRPLHRNVYIRALADARARLLIHRTHDFVNQLTKPFVFSYFTKLKGPKFRSKINGMKHIFGAERTDFTQYYKLYVNETKQEQKQISKPNG